MKRNQFSLTSISISIPNGVTIIKRVMWIISYSPARFDILNILSILQLRLGNYTYTSPPFFVRHKGAKRRWANKRAKGRSRKWATPAPNFNGDTWVSANDSAPARFSLCTSENEGLYPVYTRWPPVHIGAVKRRDFARAKDESSPEVAPHYFAIFFSCVVERKWLEGEIKGKSVALKLWCWLIDVRNVLILVIYLSDKIM